jgi:hypothetical protein
MGEMCLGNTHLNESVNVYKTFVMPNGRLSGKLSHSISVGNSSDNSPLQDSMTNSDARRPDVVIFPEHEDMMYSSIYKFPFKAT